MDIKTLLVHLDNGKQAKARVAVAAALANRFEAHLIGVAPTGWPVPLVEETPLLGVGAGLVAYQQAAASELRQQAQACVRAFEAQAASLGVNAIEGRVETAYAEDAMATAARYADLTVVTQPDPDAPHVAAPPHMAQEVLLRAGRPLLVLPHAGDCSVPADARVLVAWNGSREAARALHDALPLLRTAAGVEVAVFEAPQDVDLRHGELPGADIGLWLARHGLKVRVSHVPVKVAAGEALLSYAADMGAQLIVAGGYGHSRLRQAVLGGVTRTLMSSSPVPVLLSH
jgi:nucleotide-binding universal stress UspA family protein